MAAWDKYETVAAFAEALRCKAEDARKLTGYVDCGDFFVLDEQGEEVISGDEREVLPLFLNLLGIRVIFETEYSTTGELPVVKEYVRDGS